MTLTFCITAIADHVSRSCSRILLPGQAQSVELTEELKRRLTGVQESWAGQGQRVLLLAKKIIRHDEVPQQLLQSEQFPDYVNIQLNVDLTVVGLVGLVDPPKDDIPETIKILRGAGIRVCMVTGDFALSTSPLLICLRIDAHKFRCSCRRHRSPMRYNHEPWAMPRTQRSEPKLRHRQDRAIRHGRRKQLQKLGALWTGSHEHGKQALRCDMEWFR